MNGRRSIALGPWRLDEPAASPAGSWPTPGYAALSLHEVSLRQLRTGELPFAGLANFARLFGDDVFWLSLRHTLVFVAVSVVLEVVIGARHRARDRRRAGVALARHPGADPGALGGAADRERAALVVHLQRPVRLSQPHAVGARPDRRAT